MTREQGRQNSTMRGGDYCCAGYVQSNMGSSLQSPNQSKYHILMTTSDSEIVEPIDSDLPKPTGGLREFKVRILEDRYGIVDILANKEGYQNVMSWIRLNSEIEKASMLFANKALHIACANDKGIFLPITSVNLNEILKVSIKRSTTTRVKKAIEYAKMGAGLGFAGAGIGQFTSHHTTDQFLKIALFMIIFMGGFLGILGALVNGPSRATATFEDAEEPVICISIDDDKVDAFLATLREQQVLAVVMPTTVI